MKAIRKSQSGAERFTAQAYQDVLEKYNTKAIEKGEYFMESGMFSKDKEVKF